MEHAKIVKSEVMLNVTKTYETTLPLSKVFVSVEWQCTVGKANIKLVDYIATFKLCGKTFNECQFEPIYKLIMGSEAWYTLFDIISDATTFKNDVKHNRS